MVKNNRFFIVRIRPISHLLPRIGLLAFVAMSLAQEIDRFSPTNSLDPVAIDEQWQRAVAKYDPVRTSILKDVDQAVHDGPYRADWESLKGYTVPDWYKDAKFGIFIHWGVYAVPAFGSEWYPRMMYIPGSEEFKHHLATYGPQEKFGYKDFIPMFKAQKFDPSAWARLFREAGAKYVVPVFEHHDGFQMYDSALSDWTAVKMGPQRDLEGDLAKAVRAEGLRLGASSHRIEHNFFLGVGRSIRSDVNDPANAGFYGPAHNWLTAKQGTPLANDFTFVSKAWTDDWLARSAEIVKKYQPEVMYFDWWVGQPSVRENLTRFAAFYYNTSLKKAGSIGVINYKDYAMQDSSGVLDIERGQLSGIRPSYWQTDTSISNRSWGYIENDTFKSSDFVIHQLVDIVSKNGNLLLNIGPRADGTIPDEVQRVLREIGEWLKINGEAIYGTRPWRTFGEGPTKIVEGAFHDTDTEKFTSEDFRFTTKGETLYAIELGWPANGEAVIHSVGTGAAGERPVKSVEILGSNERVTFESEKDGLHIHLPTHAPGRAAFVFVIQFLNPK
jgi:alpha-L-fucosidase